MHCAAGTMERVCVILGNFTGIRSVLDVIIDKIRDKPDSHGVPSELKVIFCCVFVSLLCSMLMLHLLE